MFVHSILLSDFHNRESKDSGSNNSMLYRAVNCYLKNDYSVEYCVEPNPPTRIMTNMQSARIADVERHIEDGSLHLVGRDDFYSHIKKKERRDSRPATEEHVFQKFKLIFDNARDESYRNRKMVYFGYPAARYVPEDYERLFANEQSLRKFGGYRQECQNRLH